MAARTWMFAFVLSTLLCAQTAPTKPGKLAITVLNSVTRQPVDAARVTLQSLGASRPPLTGTTARDGRVEFSELVPGGYSIAEIKAPHFTYDRVGTLTVPDGTTIASTSLLIPSGEILGTVLDEDGKPASVIVNALHFAPVPPEMNMEWVEAGFAQTDAQGRFKMLDVVPGRYLVRVGTIVNRPGIQLQRTYYPSGTDPAQALRLDVGPAGIVDRIDFRLRAVELYHVRGKVAGSPPPRGGVLVQDCTTSQSSFVGEGLIAADGSFDAQGIRPGTYCVNFAERQPDRSIRSFATTPVTVVDRDVNEVALIPTPPFEIAGTILFEEGTSFPMPATLSLNSVSPYPAPVIESKVDEKGRFNLHAVLPLHYRFRLMPPAGSYIKSIKAGGQDFTSGSFNPLLGSSALTIQIAAARGRLTGRVINGTDKPAAGLTVTVVEESHRRDLMKTVSTDERGEFAVNSLAPGNYRLLAWEKYDAILTLAPAFLSLFPGTPVKLADGEERTVEVRMIPVREVESAKARF